MRKYKEERYEGALYLHSMHRYFPQDNEPKLDRKSVGEWAGMRKYKEERYEGALYLHSMHRYFPQDNEPKLDRKSERPTAFAVALF
ncbi:hypothetical protein AB3N04_14325 [Alkalihalophilus sp. As8PL]|uniref:Uncharacterized protein n=1 Tax=Alkalihalophilus sp. As8PL TaxID=3237103 RepID=A0AB39BPW1_9BACI